MTQPISDAALSYLQLTGITNNILVSGNSNRAFDASLAYAIRLACDDRTMPIFAFSIKCNLDINGERDDLVAKASDSESKGHGFEPLVPFSFTIFEGGSF